MTKKITFYAGPFARVALVTGALVINSFITKIYAQEDCTNSALIHSEDFGVGVVPVSNPDVWSFVYDETGPLTQGQYRVINNTQQGPGWHASADHTANDADGRMLVAEGQQVTFYQIFVTRETGFYPGDYSVNLFAMNLDPPGICEGNTKLPVIMVEVDYLSEDGLYVEGPPYFAPALEQTVDPVWVHIGTIFNLPPTGNFLVKHLRFWVADSTYGGPGCGNDFAIDDITLAQCAVSDPVPVTFLNINARQKGSGVSVEWSTSQELNNQSFVVEKSVDGNTNWNILASINAAGNSSTLKRYNAFDPQPFKGINYYRIKQVDIDGHFKYSKTVSVKLNINKPGVSIINPFHNSLAIDFSGLINQIVSARLLDITGKQVAAEKWLINAGNTRKGFSNVSRLHNGMYILTVSGANGGIFYNNKVVKQ